MNKRIWLITGISSGLGKALADTVLEKGDFVIGTFRKQEQVDTFNSHYPERGFALKMDLSRAEEIEAAISLVNEKFGRVDVLVNNAGYGIAGAVEEAGMDEVRAVFETNFFGTLQFTQGILPLMRAQRNGHIFQISSHSGFKGFAGFGIYNASKFALEGLSEALAWELAPLGIKLTIVEPGPFRTNFAGSSFVQAKTVIADYRETAGRFRERMKEANGKQEGDPEKAARAIFDIAQLENPPLRLPLGKIALNTLRTKIESVQQDLERFSAVAEAAVY